LSLAKLLMAGRLPSLISFFSVSYLSMFLPVCLLTYGLAPQKARRYVLLGLSYLFYWIVSGELVVYLLLSTLSVHYFGLWLDRLHAGRAAALAAAPKEEKKALRAVWQRKLRGVVALAVILHIGVLFALKYSGFFFWNVNHLLEAAHVGFRFAIPRYLQPLGISFFTLQALSYILDIYRGTQKADDNLPRLGLFMAFFPQIVEGPICRYRETAHQLYEPHDFDYHRVKFGMQRMLWGFFKKLVIADRVVSVSDTIFGNSAKYQGVIFIIGALAYTIQIYADFSGGMDIISGTAEMLGITMPLNFERPYFSRSIAEYWRRWHITLGTWFRDYVFYPLSISRASQALGRHCRKLFGPALGKMLPTYLAMVLVWLLNGIWHGAGAQFVVFGMYQGILIVLGMQLEPVFQWIIDKFSIRTDCFS